MYKTISRLIDFLTLDRARVYAVLTALLGLTVAVALLIATPERIRNNVDFPAFYNAGRIVKDYAGGELYNSELQQTLYGEIAPVTAATKSLFFVYSPFFALLFVPLAWLPYPLAFALWVLISAVLFTVGFRLVWTAAALPQEHFTNAFVIALSFLPFYSWCLLIGQTTAFGFFWLALAIYFDRQSRSVLSGLALAMLLYKPTLLLLIVPMLFVTRRWLSLMGFAAGALLLGTVSLAVIGFAGVPRYFHLLAFFSRAKASGLHPIIFDVDALSFFIPLFGQRASLIALGFAIVVAPFLVRAWQRDSWNSFAPTITWSLVLNLYVVIYDATLIILAVVLSAGKLGQDRLPRTFRWLMLALFLLPWVAKQSTVRFGLQPMTIALVAFGVYQLHLILNKPQPRSLNRYSI